MNIKQAQEQAQENVMSKLDHPANDRRRQAVAWLARQLAWERTLDALRTAPADEAKPAVARAA
ncbi:MAG: hypothetical protein ACRDWD_04780 [Acidimicrobiia bacterium]